jgi:hypothetical protein
MGGSRNPRRDRITKRLADLAVSIWPNRRGKLRFPTTRTKSGLMRWIGKSPICTFSKKD